MLRGLVRQDRQCTYKRDIEARSRNNFCRGKSISNSCSQYVCVCVCVCVCSLIPHAMRMRRNIVTCDLCGYTILFCIVS